MPSWKMGTPGWWTQSAEWVAYVWSQPPFLQPVSGCTRAVSAVPGSPPESAALAARCFSAALRDGTTVHGSCIMGVSSGGRGAGGSSFLLGTCGEKICGSGPGELSLAGFSGSAGFTSLWNPRVQPFVLRNSVKSTVFLLQQDQPL